MWVLLVSAHFEGAQACFSLRLQWRRRPASSPMVGTRATPNTSSPYPTELPEPRRKRKIPEQPASREPPEVAQLRDAEASDSGASDKEMRAAQAARARLYGGQPAQVRRYRCKGGA